jgi:multidrug efflux pump subunit AcrA (membrane-fusion protein)
MLNTTRSMLKRLSAKTLFSVALFTVASACNQKEEQKTAQNLPGAATAAPVPVVVQVPVSLPVQRSVDVVGTLYGEEDATISAKVSGRITAIYADVGDRLPPGKMLAEIDQTDYQLMARQKELAFKESLSKLGLTELPTSDFDPTKVPLVQKAKLQADNADAKFARGKQLHDQQPPLISDQDFADLQTAAAVAKSAHDVELLSARALLAEAASRKADLDLAEQRLADTIVLTPDPRNPANSPAAATSTTRPLALSTAGASQQPNTYALSARLVSVGEYVKESSPLFRVVDDDPIKYRAIVQERFISLIRLGQKASLRVEAYSEEFPGTVSRINPQVDPTNRTFQVEILVPNPTRLLKPGGFAKAAILTDTDQALFVPQSALVSFAGVNKLFTVRDNKAVEIIVETGQRRGNLIEITKGLKGPEPIIIDDPTKLANGSPVMASTASTRPTQP